MAREGVKVTRLRYDGSGVVTSDELFSLTCQLLVPYHVCMYCNSSIVKIVGVQNPKKNVWPKLDETVHVHVLYMYFPNRYNFKIFRKDAPNMVLSNEPLGS